MRVNDHTTNRHAVVKAIRRHGPISRSELTGVTGLSGATITQLTRELVGRGLVVEKKQGATDRIGRTGRRRVDLAINATGGVALGVSVGGPSGLTVSFVDLSGRNLFSFNRSWSRPRTLVAFAHEIAQVLLEAIAISPFESEQVSRVGIALPAVIDHEKGVVHFMATFRPGAAPFAELISDRLGLPVTIENDIACMARAEHWFGRARDLEDFTLVEVGYQVGSAKYRNGLPWYGANGLSSQFGHTKLLMDPDASQCYCGGRGCITNYISTFGLLERIGWLDLKRMRALSEIDELFSKLLDKFEQGEPHVSRLFEDAALQLALALANQVNSNDPGNILVMVPDERYKSFLEDRIRGLIPAMCMPGTFERTRILFDRSDDDWRWKGTAALALESIYLDDVPFLRKLAFP
jgi:predicted NBD/HSP70 family sugar kinase